MGFQSLFDTVCILYFIYPEFPYKIFIDKLSMDPILVTIANFQNKKNITKKCLWVLNFFYFLVSIDEISYDNFDILILFNKILKFAIK